MQTLKFIGSGSAFNTELGNNNAYMFDGKSLVLIDCGSTTFSRIMDLKLLEGIENITVVVTHFHPDHVGSLGDLIFYAFYVLKTKVEIVYPSKNNIKNLLYCMGIREGLYDVREVSTGKEYRILKSIIEDGDYLIEPFETSHVPEIMAYGYVLTLPNGKKIFYSGDSNDIRDDMFIRFVRGEFEEFYQDTCGLDYDGNVHLSLNKLCTLIPKQLREKVYCMHLDRPTLEDEARYHGFNVVYNQFEYQIKG